MADWPEILLGRRPGTGPPTTIGRCHDDAPFTGKLEYETYLSLSKVRERMRVAGYESVEKLLMQHSSDENGDEWIPAGADVERLTAAIVSVFTAAASFPGRGLMSEHKLMAVESVRRGAATPYRVRCSCGWTGPDQEADDLQPESEAVLRAAADFERHKATSREDS
jgi:hypothetical protein